MSRQPGALSCDTWTHGPTPSAKAVCLSDSADRDDLLFTHIHRRQQTAAPPTVSGGKPVWSGCVITI